MRTGLLVAGFFSMVAVVGASTDVPTIAADDLDVAATVSSADEGCWLKFRARNTSNQSIYIDMSKSRMKIYGNFYWSSIKNTSNQNIRAGETRRFTVWARKCGGAVNHRFQLYMKKGSQSTRISTRAWHWDELHDLGNINGYF